MSFEAKRYATLPTTGQSTRDCLDPWTFVWLDAKRGIHPCCWHPAITTLPVGGSLDEALNSAEMRLLRERLLTGTIIDHCAICPARPLTDPASLQVKVIRELARIHPRVSLADADDELPFSGWIEEVSVKGEMITFSGWGLICSQECQICLYAQVPLSVVSVSSNWRDDVSEALHDDRLGNSGFSITVQIPQAETEFLPLRLSIWTSDPILGKHKLKFLDGYQMWGG